MADLPTRFWSKVDRSGYCWEWTAAKDKYGYGRILVNKINQLAHVVAYHLTNGEIEKGMEIHHKCENRSCVNPAHLEKLTGDEHRETHGTCVSEINKKKTHCKHGHEFTVENTTTNHRPSWRACRECHRISGRRRSSLRRERCQITRQMQKK